MTSQNIIKESSLSLENRKMLTLTGVEKVCSINENQAKIEVAGSVLFVFGHEMKIKKLSIEEGVLIVDGEIDQLKYGSQKEKGGFFKRLFK